MKGRLLTALAVATVAGEVLAASGCGPVGERPVDRDFAAMRGQTRGRVSGSLGGRPESEGRSEDGGRLGGAGRLESAEAPGAKKPESEESLKLQADKRRRELVSVAMFGATWNPFKREALKSWQVADYKAVSEYARYCAARGDTADAADVQAARDELDGRMTENREKYYLYFRMD